MANPKHLKILKQGVKKWNAWRKNNSGIQPSLSGANLTGMDLNGINLSGTFLAWTNLRGAILSKANLSRANLFLANLSRADLREAKLNRTDLNGTSLARAKLQKAMLSEANLRKANLSEADLQGANLYGANLHGANLKNAKFNNASLQYTSLVEANLIGTHLTNCRIYGISAWNVKADQSTIQSNLVITKEKESEITVDNLEVAQFIYLLLNNENVRKVIDTITSKVVLILGRFTPERKKILDALRAELRQRDYSPIIFDFDKPASKDLTGTVETLARMTRFIIADLTDPSSIPHELATVVPFLRTTPVQPLRLAGTGGYSLFNDFKSYPWVLKTYEYKNSEQLIGALTSKVIGPAEARVKRLTKRKSPSLRKKK